MPDGASGYVYENIIARHTGWGLQEIRGMDYYDFQMHLHVCLAYEAADKEFDLTVAGRLKKKGVPNKGSGDYKDVIVQKFDPKTGKLVPLSPSDLPAFNPEERI